MMINVSAATVTSLAVRRAFLRGISRTAPTIQSARMPTNVPSVSIWHLRASAGTAHTIASEARIHNITSDSSKRHLHSNAAGGVISLSFGVIFFTHFVALSENGVSGK